MNRLLIVLWSLAASAAWAQHEGHESDAHGARAVQESQESAPAPPQTPAHDHANHDPRIEPRAEQQTPDPHAAHEQGAMQDQGSSEPTAETPPPAAFSGPAHAADTIFDPADMAAARAQLRTEEGGMLSSLVLADRFETRFADSEERYLWDAQGWLGGDINKLWIKSEGEGAAGDNPDDAEVQVLYSRAIAPFFDFQAGVRHDFRPGPERSHLVVGIQGLLPQLFEIDVAAFFSDGGDVTGRFEAEYDLRVTQRLILQPRIELDFAAQAIPEHGIDSGLGSVEGGLRLRYEIRREIAPYIGIAWERKLGGTADFARASGEDPRSLQAVAGIRMWF